MGWKDWFNVGGGESMTEKTTQYDDGSSKYESLRTNDSSKEDHQHTWINYDKDGNVQSGGSTPGKDQK